MKKMSVPLLDLLVVVFTLVCVALCIKWGVNDKKIIEPTIACLAAIVTAVLYFGSNYANEKQQKELIKIHQEQIDQLQDTLGQQISLLQTSKSEALRSLDSCRNQTNISQQGNNNQAANGDHNVVGNNNIVGNDGSNIVINNAEKPIFHEEIRVSELTFTHIRITRGTKVFINATGSIKVGPIAGYSGPDGKESGLFNAPLDGYNLVTEFKHAALMFKLNESEDWKECGKSYKFTADRDGELIFQINDRKQSDNEGAYTVSIEIYK